MRLQGGAPELVAGVDGAYVACAGERLTIYAQATRAELASVALDGAADVAFLGADRLLVVVRGAGRTQLCGYALPSLEPVATLELEDRLSVLAAVAGRALIVNESLEQPRLVAVTSKILVDTIPMREPLLLAAPAPEDRLLSASRTREAQLECWDPLVRRALFRLNLPLLPKAQLAGFSARRRLLWIAAGGPAGLMEVFRFSDGRLQARVELGANIVGAAGHPESQRLVVATRKSDEAPVTLWELDFQAGERRELKAPMAAPQAMCVVEGAQPALVLAANGAAPTWMPLGGAGAASATSATGPMITASTPSTPVATSVAATGAASATASATKGHPRVVDPANWRDKMQAATARAKAATAATAAARGDDTRPVTDATARATRSGVARETPEERRERAAREASEAPEPSAAHWRDELCEWAEPQLAAPRRTLDTPTLPDHSSLATIVSRLALDERAARGLALLYGARLLGAGDVAAATVARALGRDGDSDEADWDEALGHGLLGQLGLARTRNGRFGLTAAAGRFLDGAPARIPILAGSPSDAELPDGIVRLDGGAEPHAQIGERLAHRFGYDVALVLVEGPAPARMLAWKLVEARLHGAWPLVDVSAKAARWTRALDDGPTVVITRGDEVPAEIAALPAL